MLKPQHSNPCPVDQYPYSPEFVDRYELKTADFPWHSLNNGDSIKIMIIPSHNHPLPVPRPRLGPSWSAYKWEQANFKLARTIADCHKCATCECSAANSRSHHQRLPTLQRFRHYKAGSAYPRVAAWPRLTAHLVDKKKKNPLPTIVLFTCLPKGNLPSPMWHNAKNITSRRLFSRTHSCGMKDSESVTRAID